MMIHRSLSCHWLVGWLVGVVAPNTKENPTLQAPRIASYTTSTDIKDEETKESYSYSCYSYNRYM